MYFLITLGLVSVLCFYRRKGIEKKWRQFREVNKLVQTHYKTGFKIFQVSMSMICKMYWMNFIKWFEGTNLHLYGVPILQYTHNGKIYKLPLRGSRGPCPIIMAMDENGEDCTLDILSFYGPGYDWHGKKLNPHFWRKKKLIVNTISGEEFIFEEKDNIVV